MLAQVVEIHTVNWGPIIAAFITSAAVVFVAIVTSKFTWHRDEKKSLKEHTRIVRAVAHELDFYRGKLDVLHKYCEAMTAYAEKKTETLNVPAFDLLPAYLEQLKLEFAKRSSDDQLVRCVSNCHFELAFIRDRLRAAQHLADRMFEAPTSPGANLLAQVSFRREVLSLTKLVKQNLSLFNEAFSAFAAETIRKQAEVDNYETNHPFSPW